MITGIPSLHASALDLSQQAQQSLYDSIGESRRTGGLLDARVSQVAALQQAHLSELVMQLAEERDRALLDVVA